MTMEAQLKDTIHEDVEKEVEALAAGKQNQDFPQDLQNNDIKATSITPALGFTPFLRTS